MLWNFCFFPYEEAIEKVLNSTVSPFCIVDLPEKEAESVKIFAEAFFETVYECKNELFPDDTRFVIDASIQDLSDRFHLSAASLDLKVKPDLLSLLDN
jgi:hypothetical protein